MIKAAAEFLKKYNIEEKTVLAAEIGRAHV